MIEICHVVRRIIFPVVSQALMLPLHQTIWLREVEFFFVLTVGIVFVATVSIADHKRLQVIGKLSPQRFFVGSPDFVDDMA